MKLADDALFKFVKGGLTESEKTGYSNYSYWRSTWQMFIKNKMAIIILTIMGLLIGFTLIQPFLPNQKSPNKVHYEVTEQNGEVPIRNKTPNAEFWFGTNNIGQDLWARIWSGTRTSLVIGITVAGVEALIGIIVGVLWGYVRKLDRLLTEVYNIFDNIPQTIILVLMSYILRPSLQTMLIAMCLTGWIGMSRFIRNQIVIIRDREYNLASRCLGTPLYRIILRNLLPYLVSVIMLRMALAVPFAIGNEVFLTYIGLGLPIEMPSLGNLINEGRALMLEPNLRYQIIFPSVVLSIITISFYFLGNAFADAADPRNHH